MFLHHQSVPASPPETNYIEMSLGPAPASPPHIYAGNLFATGPQRRQQISQHDLHIDYSTNFVPPASELQVATTATLEAELPN